MSSFDELSNRINVLAEKLKAIEDSARHVNGRLGQLEDGLRVTQQLPSVLLDSIATHELQVLQQWETLHQSFVEGFSETAIAVEDFGEQSLETLETCFDSIAETGEEVKEALVAQIEAEWQETLNEFLDGSKDQFLNVVEEKCQSFTQAGELVRDSVEESIESLKDFLENELSQQVSREGEETLKAAIHRAEHEVMEGVVTSQLQMQLTAMMSPFILPLAIAKTVAPIIRQLLAILRMGF